MSVDRETIRVYQARADEYRTKMAQAAPMPMLVAFIDDVPAGGRVLDLGCGPGDSAAAMADAGLRVDAVDASAEMVALAAKHPGVTARQALFDDIDGENTYDGIWANFSLLHAPRDAMPRHLAALSHALKPGGQFHIALKTGDGSGRDRLGRFYTYYDPDVLSGLLADVGLHETARRFGRDTGLEGSESDWVAIRAHG